MSQDRKHNYLLVLSGYQSEKEASYDNISVDRIHEIMNEIDWNIFHQVLIFRNDSEWIQAGGNLKEDGLSCMYEEFGEQFVIEQAPVSIDQLTEILVSYYLKDEHFKMRFEFSSLSDDLNKKKEDERKLNEWRQEFRVRQKIENASKIRKLIIITILITSFSCVGYLWLTNKLPFIGRDTDTITAVVTKTKMHHIGRGYYMQTVTYQFSYNNKTYKGNFEAGQAIGK
jgi:hypothetical protein